MSPGHGAGPALWEQDEAESTARTATLPRDQSEAQSTARPRPVTLLGEKALHDLVRHGYRVAGVCRGCGSALTNPKSVAAGLGPTCAGRVAQ